MSTKDTKGHEKPWGVAQKSFRDFRGFRGPPLPAAFDGPALVEKLEHVPLVRLIPRDFHRRNRAEVEPLDERGVEQLRGESRVLRDRGHDQRGADFSQHLRLRDLHHAGVRAEEFAVRQRPADTRISENMPLGIQRPRLVFQTSRRKRNTPGRLKSTSI